MKKLSMLFAMMLLLILTVGCAKTETNDNVVRIGVDDSYPPMEFRDENNELVGFDIDFANALIEEMGMELVFEPTAWEGIFAGLTADKYDLIISSVSITEDRLEGYELSKPYLANGQVIVVKPGDDSVSSEADLAGKNVGVQIDTTADTSVTRLESTISMNNVTRYDDIIQAFADLRIGRIECIVVDYPVAIEYAQDAPDDFVITTTQLTNEPIAVMAKKGNTELINKVNAAIKVLQDNGTLSTISHAWLGDDYTQNIDETLR